MSAIQKLTDWFVTFPGIGPRQARRFVYFLLTQNPSQLAELSDLIKQLPNEVMQCTQCFRFTMQHAGSSICDICRSKNRENILMIVARDSDLEAVEKSRAFNGTYFVLGGTITPLGKDARDQVRLTELEKRVHSPAPTEIIIALGANPEGDYTTNILKEALQGAPNCPPISTLGRGLSTGTELEYSDHSTIESALENRRI